MVTWDELHQHAVDRFGGQHPGTGLEQELADHYQAHPVAVEQAVTKIADRYARGRIHSPWPLVLRELELAATRQAITANQTPERERATALAERWIDTAGIYCPTEAELQDTLFGPHGPLRAFDDDEPLRERMTDLWRQQRPRGQAAEQAARDRATPYRLAPKIAWIKAGGWMHDDVQAALLAEFPATRTADLPALRQVAAEAAARELGPTTT